MEREMEPGQRDTAQGGSTSRSSGGGGGGYTIRRATLDDIPFLPDIERSAGRLFREVGEEYGVGRLAEDEPMSEEVLKGMLCNGVGVWVAMLEAGAEAPSVEEYARRQWSSCSHGGDSVEEVSGSGCGDAEGGMAGEEAIRAALDSAADVRREDGGVIEGEVVGFLACFPLFHTPDSRDSSASATSTFGRLRAAAQAQAAVTPATQNEMSTSSISSPSQLGHTSASSNISQTTSFHPSDHDRGPSNTNTQDNNNSTTSTTAHIHIAELSIHLSHQRRGLASRLLHRMFEDTRRHPYIPIPIIPSPTPFSDDTPARSHASTLSNQPASPPASSSDAPPIQPSLTSDELSTQKQMRARVVGYSLTTYAHIPFNAPFYAKHGFQVLQPVERLRKVVGQEAWRVWKEEQDSIVRAEERVFMVREL